MLSKILRQAAFNSTSEELKKGCFSDFIVPKSIEHIGTVFRELACFTELLLS